MPITRPIQAAHLVLRDQRPVGSAWEAPYMGAPMVLSRKKFVTLGPRSAGGGSVDRGSMAAAEAQEQTVLATKT